MIKITDEMKLYYDKKLRCPICNSKIVETNIKPPTPVYGKEYKDTINRTVCPDCGWVGVMDKLRK